MDPDEEFRRFFDEHFGRLHQLGYLLTGSWAEGEELAQDALVSTLSAWPRIGERPAPAATPAPPCAYATVLPGRVTVTRITAYDAQGRVVSDDRHPHNTASGRRANRRRR